MSDQQLTVYQQIQKEVEKSNSLPFLIALPKEMYDAFIADVASTGHAATVWGRPVEQRDDVYEITLLFKN